MKTLFINCCPRKESRTRRIAHALLEKMGDYEELNLYDCQLLPMDEKRLAERNHLLEKKILDHDAFAMARQFAAAEKIVIAAPFWDLSFPAKLKLYIENIYVTGIVSTYDEKGMPKGLCQCQDFYYVTTAGGPYDGRYSYEYLKTLCQDYFGIANVKLIKAEMLDIVGNNAEEIVSNVIGEL